MKIAVITFDEPELEPSYVNTRNIGKGIFGKIFFTGKCSFNDINTGVYQKRSFFKGSVFLLMQLYFAIKSLFAKSETIFEFLEKNEVKGTFFGVFNLIDKDVQPEHETYLSIFKKITAEGHELGLHGYGHCPLNEQQLQKSVSLAGDLLGVELMTYSSPWGDDREETEALLKKYGFKGFRVWTMKPDTQSIPVKVSYVNSVNGSINDEVVVLNIHAPDMYPFGKSKIQQYISVLKAKGYTFMPFINCCEFINGKG